MFDFHPKDFPDDPGVYQMLNAQAKVLYVGKALNLRSRLSSYFRDEPAHPRTRAMVAQVASVDILVTGSEKEALLLEASLIKKHRPRYNIVLRDDKSYILFKLDKTHPFPRIAFTRRVERDGSAYFGPFTSALAARKTWRELGKLFPLRKCRDASFANRVRPCLYHHIGQCLAPCVGRVDRETYLTLVRRVEAFLSGRSAEVLKSLERQMLKASDALEFERAAELRDLIAAMKRTVEGQAVVLPGLEDLDVLETFEAAEGLGLCVLFVRQGRLLDKAGFFWPDFVPDEMPQALPSFLTQFYRVEGFVPPAVLLPRPLLAHMGPQADTVGEILAERRGGPVRLAAPRGEGQARLMEMARANAAQTAREALGVRDEAAPAMLGRKLRLGREIGRIEAVDISHLGGKGVRAGMVVFEDGRFKKEDYRHYAFPELEGTSDDYAALAAWARRRLASGPPFADLVLIDGGKGQLAAVERSLVEAGQAGIWELAAIAKSGRARGAEAEQVFRPGRKNPLGLRPGSRELLFLQRLRDAVHDFVVSGQRKSRTKKALKSEVLAIPGVGPKTAKLLWDRFESLEAMRRASLEDLAQVPGLGPKKAAVVLSALRAGREH